jgi:quercetin dioxygenase-like cupin family protein
MSEVNTMLKYSISEEEIKSKLSWLRLGTSKEVPHLEAWYKVLFGQADGARSMMVRMQRYTRGGNTHAHFHGSEEQLYIILEGKGLFKVGEEEYTVTPGSIVFIPINTKHYYENIGDGDLVFLFIRSFLGSYGVGQHNIRGGPDEIEPSLPLKERVEG